MDNNTFPAFTYTAQELSAFIFSFDTFIIGLKNKQVISFTPADVEAFRQWLLSHHIREITHNE